MAEDKITFNVVAFYYEEGNSAMEYVYKDTSRVSVKCGEDTSSLKKFNDYISSYIGVEKIASSKGLGKSLEKRFARIDDKGVRIAINTDQQLENEFDELRSGSKLQIIVTLKRTVFRENSERIVIDVVGQTSSSKDNVETINVESESSPRYELTEEERISLNTKFDELGGSSVIKGVSKRRSVKSHKKRVHVDWPWYVKCGTCAKEIALRIDANDDGRVNAFEKHYKTHERPKSSNKSILAFTRKRTAAEAFEEIDRADDDEVQIVEELSAAAPAPIAFNAVDPDLGVDLDAGDGMVRDPNLGKKSSDAFIQNIAVNDKMFDDFSIRIYDPDLGQDLDDSSLSELDQSTCFQLNENIVDFDFKTSDDEISDVDLGRDSEIDINYDEQYESVQLPDKITYSIEYADPMCVKLNELISQGKIPKDGILYKHLRDVVEINYDPSHQYDQDVLEFFNTIAYLGGNSTANFVRGPMRTGRGRNDTDPPSGNFQGPSRPTRTKKRSGYTAKSGVIKELSLCQMKLATHCKPSTSFLIANETVKVIPCVLSSYGNALKPAIELDKRLKRLIGLDLVCDYQFVKDNPAPSPEFLKTHIVVEVVISNVTSLDNGSSMPIIAEYVPKQGKSGENLTRSFLNNIRLIQTCERCQSRAKADEHIISLSSVQCDSSCARCLNDKAVCEDCQELGYKSYLPCLRACSECLKSGSCCIRRVVLVLCADCESGNKAAFRGMIDSIKNEEIDPHLYFLTILPDAVHVGKSMKASFSNWMLVLGNERGFLGLLRTLRSRSPREVVEKMHGLIKKSDHVLNRDRQNPSAVIALTRPDLTQYLISLNYVSSTIIPEMSKYTEKNRIGTYPKPVDVCVADYGFILVLFAYDHEQGTSSLLRASYILLLIN